MKIHKWWLCLKSQKVLNNIRNKLNKMNNIRHIIHLSNTFEAKPSGASLLSK